MNEKRTQFAEIAAAARAWLEVEQELGTEGIIRVKNQTFPVAASPEVIDENNMKKRSVKEKEARLAELAKEAQSCRACQLCKGRQQTVFSRGNLQAELFFVGEGPGADEDEQGVPFVGAAGKLLNRMITAMHFSEEEVYIANAVKCRPPDNRTPTTDEVKACERFLVGQLETVAPKVIVALGKSAAQMLGIETESGQWRGNWSKWRSIPLIATYHPAFLLYSPKHKPVVWEDLQQVMARLGKS
jgi:uracil-DNA glycosylase